VKQYFHAHTYNICKVHGKMPLDEKEQNMNAFIKGNAHIMVATTVIEVGVNVPLPAEQLPSNVTSSGEHPMVGVTE
jgi:RecG-like helicase